MKKGFTLIEVFTVVVIIFIITTMIISYTVNQDDIQNGNIPSVFWSEEQRRDWYDQKQLEELQRMNDIRERELKLREMNLPPERPIR